MDSVSTGDEGEILYKIKNAPFSGAFSILLLTSTVLFTFLFCFFSNTLFF